MTKYLNLETFIIVWFLVFGCWFAVKTMNGSIAENLTCTDNKVLVYSFPSGPHFCADKPIKK